MIKRSLLVDTIVLDANRNRHARFGFEPQLFKERLIGKPGNVDQNFGIGLLNILGNFFGDVLENGLGSYHRWGVWGLLEGEYYPNVN